MLTIGKITDFYHTRAIVLIMHQLTKRMLMPWKKTLKFPVKIRNNCMRQALTHYESVCRLIKLIGMYSCICNIMQKDFFVLII